MGADFVGPILMPAKLTPAIELNQVFLGWGNRVAVRDVTGKFLQGSMTAIVGPNGAGKSTLVRGIIGQLSPLQGQIFLSEPARNSLAYMPQSDHLDRSFPISVYDMVAFGAWPRVGAWKNYGNSEHENIMNALEQVGLADFASRIIGTLSGGQIQRALFARLLLSNAQVLVLDEPFAAVDHSTTDELLNLMAVWHSQGRTVIVVLHDLDMVRAHFPDTLLLAGQVVSWGLTRQVLTTDNLHMARHLCAGDY